MGNDVHRKFTVDLEIRTGDAEKKLKQTIANLSKMGSNFGGLESFENLVDYLVQVNEELDKFKQKYGDGLFSQMFGGLDLNLRRDVEAAFGHAREKTFALEELKTKARDMKTRGEESRSGLDKSDRENLKYLEKDILSLYESIGQKGAAQITGKGKAVDRLNAAIDALERFGVVFEEVNKKISSGFQFGRIEEDIMQPGKKLSGQLKKTGNEIEQEVDELNAEANKYKKTLEIFNNTGARIDISNQKKTDTEVLTNLQDRFTEAKQKVDTLAAAGKQASEEYHNAIAEAVKYATLLNNTAEYVYQNGTERGKRNAERILYGEGKKTIGAQRVGEVKKFLTGIKDNGDFEASQKYFEQQRQNILNKANVVKASETTVNDNKKVAMSYDELIKKVREYIELEQKTKHLNKGAPDRVAAVNRQSQIMEEIDALAGPDADTAEIYDAMSEDNVDVNNIMQKLCALLKIDLPQGFNNAEGAATSGFKKITQGANEASTAIQQVMYHLGNLLGKGQARDTFGQMPENLTSAVEGSQWEQYGFGVLGGGLFGVADPSTMKDQPVGKSKFIQSIDISKYNMYMANTEERAMSLIDFLSKLQKFAFKTAEPNYTGFDAQLNNIDANALFEQFRVVFTEVDLTQNEFNNFINEMVSLLRQAGLKFNSETEELEFTSIGELENTENISTRFMKKLGYEGVNVGGTSLDGFGQGSVLFDFKESDIVGYFNSAEEAVRDFNNIISQTDGNEWIGSVEQLQQYRQNIDAIIDRLEKSRNAPMTPVDKENLESALSKLSRVKTKIDEIISAQSGSQFAKITGNVEETSQSKPEQGPSNSGRDSSEMAAGVRAVGDAASESAQEVEELRQELAETRQESERLRQENNELQEGSERRDQLIEDSSVRAEQAERQHQLISEEVVSLRSERDSLSREASELQDALTRSEGARSELEEENSGLRQDLESVAQQRDSFEQQLIEERMQSQEHVAADATPAAKQADTQQQNDILSERLSLIKQISSAYDNLADAKSDGSDSQIETARSKVDELEEKYYSVVATMNDGSKVNIVLDDEFAVAAENIIKNVQNIQNIELVPRSAEAAIKASENIDSSIASLSKHWSNLDTIERAVDSFKNVDSINNRIEYLNKAIQTIKANDSSFEFVSEEQYNRAVGLVQKLKTLRDRKILSDSFGAELDKLQMWDDGAFITVTKDIREGTLTTLDQCIAKFKELAAVQSQQNIEIEAQQQKEELSIEQQITQEQREQQAIEAQTDQGVDSSRQQLENERQITEEKKEQASIERDKQAKQEEYRQQEEERKKQQEEAGRAAAEKSKAADEELRRQNAERRAQKEEQERQRKEEHRRQEEIHRAQEEEKRKKWQEETPEESRKRIRESIKQQEEQEQRQKEEIRQRLEEKQRPILEKFNREKEKWKEEHPDWMERPSEGEHEHYIDQDREEYQRQKREAEEEARYQERKRLEEEEYARKEVREAKRDENNRVFGGVYNKLYDVANTDNMDLGNDVWKLIGELGQVQSADDQILDDLLKSGLYLGENGEQRNLSDLLSAINELEQKYQMDLTDVRDYLRQVYDNPELSELFKEPTIVEPESAQQQKNEELKEQISLEQQAAAADTPRDNSDLQTIQQENDALREQASLEQQAAMEDVPVQNQQFDELSESAQHADDSVAELGDTVKDTDSKIEALEDNTAQIQVTGEEDVTDELRKQQDIREQMEHTESPASDEIVQEQQLNDTLEEQVSLEQQADAADTPKDTTDLQVTQQENDAIKEQISLETQATDAATPADNGSVQAIERKNDALREQVSLEGQASVVDTPKDNGDVKVTQQENEELKEQIALKQKSNNLDNTGAQPKKQTRTTQPKVKKTAEQKADETVRLGDLNKHMKGLKDAAKNIGFDWLGEGLTEEQRALSKEFIKITAEAIRCSDAIEAGGKVELDTINAAIDALRDKIKAYKEQNNIVDGSKKKSQSNAVYGTGIMNANQKKFDNLQNIISQDTVLSGSDVVDSQFKEYEASLKRLQALYDKFKNQKPTEAQEKEFREASAECNNLGKEVNKLIKDYQKLHNDPAKVGEMSLDDSFDINNIKSRQKALRNYVESTHGANAANFKFNKGFRELYYTIDNGDGTFTKARAAIDSLGSAIVETAGESEAAKSKMKSFIGEIGQKFQSLFRYMTSMLGVQEVFQQIRKGIQYIRDIDAALTELKKVTNETDAAYDAFLQNMSKTAGVVGSTVSELTTMAAEWARLNI